MAFTLRWYPEIFNDMLGELLALTGVTDILPGSIATTLLSVAAREDARAYASMLKLIDAINLDSLSGADLDAKAFEHNLTRILAQPSSGVVTIGDSTFTKVSTRIYPGLPGPIRGDTSVNGAVGNGFPASGTLIVGRGTDNVETVSYLSITVNVGYVTFNLSSGLTNDHGTEETIIFSQGGNRTIAAGTGVRVVETDSSPALLFTTNNEATLLDGETSLEGVQVTCTEAGALGNVPVGAISEYDVSPFVGATVTNPLPFTNGKDEETDEDLRDRIRNHHRSLAKGTKIAILMGITGLTDAFDNKRVVSATYVDGPINTTLPNIVYIDDGTANFEPSFLGVGIETVMQEAAGTEVALGIQNFPIMKASLITESEAPFNVSAADQLVMDVDGTSETITFASGDFAVNGAARASEIAERINNSSTLVEARTTDGQKRVIITARAEENERLQVLGGTANVGLQFIENQVAETIRLYKNDVLLSKDGRAAFLDTANTLADMDFTGGPFTFVIDIDGNTSNPITVTINSGDFVAPASPTMAEVLAAINDDLVGATATGVFNNTRVRLTSNKGPTSASKLDVQPGGTALGPTKLDFATGEVTGINADYSLNRWNGQVLLGAPLVALDHVTAGTRATRAFLDCVNPEPYAITAGQTLVIRVDGSGDLTFTFAGGVYLAQDVINEIEASRFSGNNLRGTGFEVANRGGVNYLRIRTNSWNPAWGSIEVRNTSTAVNLNFPYNTPVFDVAPNVGYSETGNMEDYTQGRLQQLVVELDDDPENRTFSPILSWGGSVTTSIDASNFIDSALPGVFEFANFFTNFTVQFDTNTTTAALRNVKETITVYNEISGQLTTTNPLPAVPVVGDTFQLIPVTAFNVVEFINVPETSQLGIFGDVAVTDQGRRVQISSKLNGSAGQVHVLGGTGNSLSIPFSSNGTVAGTFTVDSISGLSVGLLATVDDDNTGSLDVTITDITGVIAPFTIEVDGGATDLSMYTTDQDARILSRNQLGFESTLKKGVDGYTYFRGLLQKVQWTIDGYDADLTTYPGIKAAGVKIDVKSPVIHSVVVTVNVTSVEGVTVSSLESLVKSVIAAYVNSLKVGEDVLVAEIIDRVMDVPGVKDVQVLLPVANEVIQDHEIARIDLQNITVA